MVAPVVSDFGSVFPVLFICALIRSIISANYYVVLGTPLLFSGDFDSGFSFVCFTI